jgi:hypothetical protein
VTFPTDPANITDFVWFIQNVMQVPATALPTNVAADPDVTTAWAVALETVDCFINQYSPLYYNLAMYNFAGDYLINWASDSNAAPNMCSTYFTDLRKKWNITGFVAGTVSSVSDEGTSTSLDVPPQVQGLAMFDLQMLKTPFGRAYMNIASKFGDIWGLS